MVQQAFVQPQRQVQGSAPTASGSLQRKCNKCSRKKKKPKLQRSKVSPAPEMMPTVPEEQRPSAAVDAATYAFMKPPFSHDFSQIPVHSRSQGRIQAKLRVNAPGDVYEQEADRVAEKVMAQPVHDGVSTVPPQIQRLSGSSGGQMEAPASVDQALASPGRPLPAALRQEMEGRFGHDFSRVRVHSDAAAEQSARDMSARAYTAGQNIAFGANQFAPGSSEGRRLLAHELTHIVQQSITGKPADSSANVFRAITELGANNEDNANATKDVDDESTSSTSSIPSTGSRAPVKCSDGLSFSLLEARPSIKKNSDGITFGPSQEISAGDVIKVPTVEFKLDAWVRADKHKRIKNREIRQWRLGFIQNIRKEVLRVNYSDYQQRENLTKCGYRKIEEESIDCTKGNEMSEKIKPWYPLGQTEIIQRPTKRAFARLTRHLVMKDDPLLEGFLPIYPTDWRSVLRSVHWKLEFSTFVVANKNKFYCPLGHVDWGFIQNAKFHLTVVKLPSQNKLEFIDLGKKPEQELDLIPTVPSVWYGPDPKNQPVTQGDCPGTGFMECPAMTGKQQPTTQSSQSNQPP